MSLQDPDDEGRSLEEQVDDLIEKDREIFDGLHE
jgi:hypothetical protein